MQLDQHSFIVWNSCKCIRIFKFTKTRVHVNINKGVHEIVRQSMYKLGLYRIKLVSKNVFNESGKTSTNEHTGKFNSVESLNKLFSIQPNIHQLTNINQLFGFINNTLTDIIDCRPLLLVNNKRCRHTHHNKLWLLMESPRSVWTKYGYLWAHFFVLLIFWESDHFYCVFKKNL